VRNAAHLRPILADLRNDDVVAREHDAVRVLCEEHGSRRRLLALLPRMSSVVLANSNHVANQRLLAAGADDDAQRCAREKHFCDSGLQVRGGHPLARLAALRFSVLCA
jgi:hypothetical protein